jgi:ectoine hydroxylase-related dioxygenase (phytanoyl-CoA dioxygenase family)
MLTKQEKIRLETEGYLVIKNFVNLKQVEVIRNALENHGRYETLSNEKIKYFPLSDKIIYIMNDVLNGKIYYPFLSVVANGLYNTQNSKAYMHNDARFDDYNFKKNYNIYNVGLYLQDHANYSGGLKVRPGSHKKILIEGRTYFEKIKNFLKKVLRNPSNLLSILRTLLPYKSINLKTDPGDLVIWNLRLHHSGNSIRIKFLKDVSLSTYVENIIPDFMILKNKITKFAIITIYIGECDYKEQYINEQISKPQQIEFWRRTKINFSELENLTKGKNLDLIDRIKKIISSN